MSEAPVQLIVAAFQEEDGAKNALNELKTAKKEHLIKIDNAAVITKDENGKVHIKETKDMGGGKGAVIGAGSVVKKDIPDYAIAVGNPACVIKIR